MPEKGKLRLRLGAPLSAGRQTDLSGVVVVVAVAVPLRFNGQRRVRVEGAVVGVSVFGSRDTFPLQHWTFTLL